MRLILCVLGNEEEEEESMLNELVVCRNLEISGLSNEITSILLFRIIII